MNEQNLILSLSMNEQQDSSIARDSSPSGANGIVEGDAYFRTGRNGAALHCNGGHCDVERDLVDFSQDFTMEAWIRQGKTEPLQTRIGILVRTGNGPDDYSEAWYTIPEDLWISWAIVKQGLDLRVYLGFTLLDTIHMAGTPTGLGILQDYYSKDYGHNVDIDEVKVYQSALTPEQIIESQANSKRIRYSLDGVTFESMGITVSESKGLLEKPKMKTPLTIDYPDYHGEVVDLKDKRFEAREIQLKCWCKADGEMDFIAKMNTLYDILQRDGTQRLKVDINPARPLVYDVYCTQGIDPDKRWNDKLMIGTFTLKLREPDPEKRVVAFTALPGRMTAEIALTTEMRQSISWGDGATTDEAGTDTYTHTYSQPGTYHIIVAGIIKEITNMTTNGIIVWNKL